MFRAGSPREAVLVLALVVLQQIWRGNGIFNEQCTYRCMHHNKVGAP